MTDIEQMTNSILYDVQELHKLWSLQPRCRKEFGKREIADIELAKDRLAELEQFILIHLNRQLRGVA